MAWTRFISCLSGNGPMWRRQGPKCRLLALHFRGMKHLNLKPLRKMWASPRKLESQCHLVCRLLGSPCLWHLSACRIADYFAHVSSWPWMTASFPLWPWSSTYSASGWGVPQILQDLPVHRMALGFANNFEYSGHLVWDQAGACRVCCREGVAAPFPCYRAAFSWASPAVSCSTTGTLSFPCLPELDFQ